MRTVRVLVVLPLVGIKGLRAIGLKPLMVGLSSALLVGVVSWTLVTLLY